MPGNWFCECCKANGKEGEDIHQHLSQHYQDLNAEYKSLCESWSTYLTDFEKRNRLFYERSIEIQRNLLEISSLLHEIKRG